MKKRRKNGGTIIDRREKNNQFLLSVIIYQSLSKIMNGLHHWIQDDETW
jgi:hypothetical protein